MKIAIIGAGIIGVTTAYELAVDGHEVHVFERRASACEEASFAHAGLTGSAAVLPSATPSALSRMLINSFAKHAPERFRLPFRNSELGWIRKWHKASSPQNFSAAFLRLEKLATYSAERLASIRQTLQLEFDTASGHLMLFRSEKDFAQFQPNLALLQEAGIQYQLMDATAARQSESGMHPSTALHQAIRLQSSQVANSRQFALMLKDKAIQRAAHFHFGVTVKALNQHSLGFDVATDGTSGAESADFEHVVLCAGIDAKRLLKPMGLFLPLIPVYGYSISAALREPLDAPSASIMDERYRVSISRLGNRIRVAGGAEIGGNPHTINQAQIQTLYKVLADWFPASADTQKQVQVWKGASPSLPNGLPVIGQLGTEGPRNLWLNVGHGQSGWALACGSARVIADQISGQTTPFNF
jgi:D-amino-acid dehydrogenase